MGAAAGETAKEHNVVAKKDWLRAAQLGCGDISLDSPHSLLLFPAGRLEAVQAHHANQATSLDDIADTKKLDGP
jgi:hypothetical protein